MNEYIEALKRYVAEKPPNYGSDAKSILEMLFTYYHECNNTDTDAMKVAFEDLYQRMHDMPLREMDRIVDAVCTLCREHEKDGFVEGGESWGWSGTRNTKMHLAMSSISEHGKVRLCCNMELDELS